MADFAVLPIENSSAGIVSSIYDLLVEFENYIVGEQVMKIENCLMSVKGAKLSDIRTVYSHPQALMQSAKYLEEHREWQQISMLNTRRPARMVAREQDPSKAAIANSLAAKLYDLDTWNRRCAAMRPIPPGLSLLPIRKSTGRMPERSASALRSLMRADLCIMPCPILFIMG